MQKLLCSIFKCKLIFNACTAKHEISQRLKGSFKNLNLFK